MTRPPIDYSRFHIAFIILVGMTGLCINLVLSSQLSRADLMAMIALYGGIILVGIATARVSALRRWSGQTIIALTYIGTGFDLAVSLGGGIDSDLLWTMLVPTIGCTLVGMLSRKWWGVLPYAAFTCLVILLTAIFGVLSNADAVIITTCTLVIALAVTATTAIRLQTERALTRLNQDYAVAREEAEAATRLKSEFLATMSHEIRTPMNGIVGMADLIADTPLTDEQQESIDIIRTSAGALLNIINDVLDLSKIEAGSVEVESVRFAPAELAQQALDVVHVQATERGLQLHLEVATGLAPNALGDPTKVRQVLLNLLSNAVKFTHRGSVTLRVGRDGSQLQFEVVDTGIGMSQEELGVVFDSFTQADASTTREYGGTGLGLTISQRLAVLMGGTLTAASERGQGSTFTLCIEAPVADSLQHSSPLVATALAEAPQALPEHGLRVLVAEDDVVNQTVVRHLLARLGIQADIVGDGAQALSTLLEAAEVSAPYDLVLMDIQMPTLDGLAATRRIRTDLAAEVQPTILALTANAMEGDREQCLDAGADGYLTKPIRRLQLAEQIARVRPVDVHTKVGVK